MYASSQCLHFHAFHPPNKLRNSQQVIKPLPQPSQRHESMRVLIALLLAQASALLFKPHRTRTHLRSDPRDEAIEVEAYVEDLIDEVVKDVKKAKEEEINQQSVDAMIDSAIGSDDDPFKDIPKATGLLDNL